MRGALWTGIHTAISLPLAFAVNILLARVLGVADYGRLAYLTTVITIAGVIAGLGVTTALIQFGAKAHAKGDQAQVRRLLSGAQGFRLMVSGPLVALAVLALVRVDSWLLAVALVFGVGAPALLGSARPALTIENRTDRSAQITMIGNLVLQAAVVLTVLTLGTADAVWSARVIASGLLLALPLIAISSAYRMAVLSPTVPWRLPRRFWSFAVPAGLAGIIGTLVTDRTEIVFLDWFADERAMGLFGLAFGLAGHVYAPAQAFIGPLVPAVSALAEVDVSSLRRAFLRTTRVGAAVGGLMVASFLPALAVLLPLIYGRDFAPAGDLLVIIGVGSAVMLVGAPHQAFLMARLQGRLLLWINVVSLVVSLTLALVLIPELGALGAAIACCATFIVRTLQLTAGEVRASNTPLGAVIRSAGSLVWAILVAVALWMVARSVDIDLVLLGLTLVVTGTLLYFAGLKGLGLGLDSGDVEAIRRALPGRLQNAARLALTPLRGVKTDGVRRE